MRRLKAVAGVCLSLCICGAIAWANCGFPLSTLSSAAEYVEGATYERLPSTSSNPAWVEFFQDQQWTVLIGFGGLSASIYLLFNKPEQHIELTREEKLETLRRLWDKDQ